MRPTRIGRGGAGVGADLSELKIAGYRMPDTFEAGTGFGGVLSMMEPLFKNGFTVRPSILTGDCVACGTCRDACPVQAISNSGQTIRGDRRKHLHSLLLLPRDVPARRHRAAAGLPVPVVPPPGPGHGSLSYPALCRQELVEKQQVNGRGEPGKTPVVGYKGSGAKSQSGSDLKCVGLH